jgi:hypothetical protein
MERASSPNGDSAIEGQVIEVIDVQIATLSENTHFRRTLVLPRDRHAPADLTKVASEISHDASYYSQATRIGFRRDLHPRLAL